MIKHAALFLFVPMVAWANELPPPKAEPKPIKPAESHATPAAHSAPAPASSAKLVSKHAAPQQMAEPIKIAKPAAAHAPVAAPEPEAHAAAPEVLKPSGQPITRYVSPQFSAAKAAAHRPVVHSKAPSASSRSHSAKSTESYAMKPGLVRVLPASQIPSSAILPPSKQIKWGSPVSNQPSAKTNVTWGEMGSEVVATPETKGVSSPNAVPIAGRKMASPKFYSETNQELRWQYYSYP